MTTRLLIDHIISDSEKRRSRPMIDGTGITVQDVADSLHNGLTPDQIAVEFDLTMGEVHAALSYYHDHKAEIDSARQDDKSQADAQLRELEAKGQVVSLEALKRRIEARKR
jgi:uncharacterized protein (DUF433 family)